MKEAWRISKFFSQFTDLMAGLAVMQKLILVWEIVGVLLYFSFFFFYNGIWLGDDTSSIGDFLAEDYG